MFSKSLFNLSLVMAILFSPAFGNYGWAADKNDAYFASALNNYSAGKYSQALSLFGQSARNNPNNVLSHYYMALCYQRLNQVALANQEYTWVSQHTNDANMKANAQHGLAQLNQYQSKRTYSGIQSPAGSKPVAKIASSYAGGRPKIIEFSATWCGPCKSFAPIFDSVKSTYSSRADFQSIDVDDESKKNLVNQYSVSSVPTIVFINGQGKLVDKQQGTMSEAGFSSRVEQLLQGR